MAQIMVAELLILAVALQMSVKSSGKIKGIINQWQIVTNTVIDVGIAEPKIKVKDGQRVQLALVYAVQEQGSKKTKVPARPTLRPAVENAKYTPRIRNLITNIAVGNPARIGLNKIGEVVTLKAKSNIQGIKSPKLKAATIANRVNAGTTNPLVDTGQLKRGVGWKLNKK